MKTDIADLWVEALRSGKYEQGKFSLQENGKFCCLGVLCELAFEAGVASMQQLSSGNVQYDYASAFLPESVLEWSGIENVDGRIPGEMSLSQMNDGGKFFPEIADYIDKNRDLL